MNSVPRVKEPASGMSLSLQEKINLKVSEIAAVADQIPSVVIIHNIEDLSVSYMSKKGTEILGVSLEELQNMGPTYHENFFRVEQAEEYVPKIMGLLERNQDDESICFYQQVRGLKEQEWHWYLTSVRILLRNEDGKPLLTICTATPVDDKHSITVKVARLAEENAFLRSNYHKFSLLTSREREVLALLAVGKSSAEIAREIYISVATAETHRRNIKRKLNAATSFELSQYARAFDLI